ITHALAAKILAGTNDSALGSVMGSVQGPAAFGGNAFDERWITGLANDLMAKPGASLVLAGSSQPVAVQLLAYAMNAAVKNLGHTLFVRQMPRNPRTLDICQRAADINDGRITQLLLLGGDPVYTAPPGSAGAKQTSRP